MLAPNLEAKLMAGEAPGADTGATAAGPEPELPLAVVERGAGAPSRRPGSLWRLLRPLRFVPLMMLLVAVGGVVGLYFQPPGLKLLMAWLDLQPGAGTATPIAVPAPRAPAAPPEPAPQAVVGLGTLLPAGDIITVAMPFGAGDARIASLEVAEGQEVARGQVLARLDNEAQLEAAVESARATVAAREAALAQTRASVAASREEARAALARAEAAAANRQADFERTATLLERGFATRALLGDKETALEEARQEVERSRAALGRYDYEDLSQQPDVAVAARNLDAARADLARAERDGDKAAVRAPVAGTVLTIHVRPGERPGAEGVLNLGDLSRMTADVEVYQTQVGRVGLGAPVELTADALPQPLHGEVTRIGLEVGRQTLIDADPAANTDARVVTVTVALDEESTAIARRFTNLQVTARIGTGAPER